MGTWTQAGAKAARVRRESGGSGKVVDEPIVITSKTGQKRVQKSLGGGKFIDKGLTQKGVTTTIDTKAGTRETKLPTPPQPTQQEKTQQPTQLTQAQQRALAAGLGPLSAEAAEQVQYSQIPRWTEAELRGVETFLKEEGIRQEKLKTQAKIRDIAVEKGLGTLAPVYNLIKKTKEKATPFIDKNVKPIIKTITKPYWRFYEEVAKPNLEKADVALSKYTLPFYERSKKVGEEIAQIKQEKTSEKSWFEKVTGKKSGLESGYVISPESETGLKIAPAQEYGRGIVMGMEKELFEKPASTLLTVGVGVATGAVGAKLATFAPKFVKGVGIAGQTVYAGSVALGAVQAKDSSEYIGKQLIKFLAFGAGTSIGAKLVTPTPTLKAKGTVTGEGFSGKTVTQVKFKVGKTPGKQTIVTTRKGYGESLTRFGKKIYISKFTPKTTTTKIYQFTKSGKTKLVGFKKEPTQELFQIARSQVLSKTPMRQLSQSMGKQGTIARFGGKTKLEQISLVGKNVGRFKVKGKGQLSVRTEQAVEAMATPSFKLATVKYGAGYAVKKGVIPNPKFKFKGTTTGKGIATAEKSIPTKFVLDKVDPLKPVRYVERVGTDLKLGKFVPFKIVQKVMTATGIRGQFKFQIKPKTLITQPSFGKKGQLSLTQVKRPTTEFYKAGVRQVSFPDTVVSVKASPFTSIMKPDTIGAFALGFTQVPGERFKEEQNIDVSPRFDFNQIYRPINKEQPMQEFKPIQETLPEQKVTPEQSIDLRSDVMQRPIQEQVPFLEQFPQQVVKQEITPIKTKVAFKPVTPFSFGFVNFFGLDLELAKKKKKKMGAFFTLVKSGGKWRRVGGALTKKSATALGISITKRTPAASFKIMKGTGFGKEKDFGINVAREMAKYRSPIKKGEPLKGTGVFIEKNKFRIDTGGEYRGISLLGQRTSRKRGGYFGTAS